MPLLCRFRSKSVSYLRAAFLSAHRSYSIHFTFIRAPLFSIVVKLGRQPSTPAFADVQNTLTAAQSRQVHAVTQCGPSVGSFAYQGTGFRCCFWDGNRDLRMCPFLCREMKGWGGLGGVWTRKKRGSTPKSGGALLKSSALSSSSSTTLTERRCNVSKGFKVMQQKWGCSGGLWTVTMCLFLIIYPVIITILAKIKHTHTHIAHYLGNTAYQKLISCWGRLSNPDWPWDIPITMSQCLRESLLSYLSWNTHCWFMRRVLF